MAQRVPLSCICLPTKERNRRCLPNNLRHGQMRLEETATIPVPAPSMMACRAAAPCRGREIPLSPCVESRDSASLQTASIRGNRGTGTWSGVLYCQW